MSFEVNFVTDEDVKGELEALVEKGGRSRVINEALRREPARILCERALNELTRLRGKTRSISTAENIGLLRRDRKRTSIRLSSRMLRSS